MFKRKRAGPSLQSYEEQAFALYFAHEIHYPYVSIALVSLVAAWLMVGHVPTLVIAIWFFGGAALSLLREAFVWHMKPQLAQGRGYRTILRGFALSSLLTGITWGAFAWLYFDPQRPLSVLMVGSYLAGHVGGAVTPLAIYLPAFYLFLLPILLPYVVLLVLAGTQEHLVLAGLSTLFLLSMARYAHMTNRLHRESMRLRHENQKLIEDLGFRKAEAENASRTKSLFLAGISHDLRQPLRAIAMYTGFLRHSAAQGADKREAVAQTASKIETAVASIQGQVGRLLELSRLESGTLALNLEAVPLDDVFTHVESLFATQAQARGVRLQVAAPRHRVWADRGMLDSIVQNLVSNAIKHTDHGRSVYLGTRVRTQYPAGQQLCIEVRDAGSGVAAERIPLLFDAYRSFDDRSASESHGLGLAIAKAQASYLGCDIAVASQPGCGSTFTLCGLRPVSADAAPA
ncbi:HAMP domain-containing sensor histidine kinase [Hydrogenophaga sp.]|uniref:sensor histidine kinase n=1 Tax=Hydrogenophaga sp. TaxID=1904254 RepID=UPI002715AD66|nr:HAMP domain-containing sensor histidine kinase [Hydrogenophaga sp.]MDO9438376.1 HAMP domain-containing sensor histidine kinase [Hydrogenophaga sp.]